MGDSLAEMSALLESALAGSDPGDRPGAGIAGLTRLSGGANMETWSFDLLRSGSSVPLILRRLPLQAEAHASVAAGMDKMDLRMEADLIGLAGQHGVSVPTVVLVLTPEQGLGTGFVMSREEGEALPSRLLTDARFASARQTLAGQCGTALARIHGIPLQQLPTGMRDNSMEEQLDRYQSQLDQYGNGSPVHQLALNWLRDNRPLSGRRSLVHGDFRNGNLLVDEQGLASVLDWELAHIGDPAEDLGYLCANVWRFGRYDLPVGGFGHYAQLLEGYLSVAGWAPSMAEIHYWEACAALTWGLVCLAMLDMYRSGEDRSLERAAIGRRLSESEIDLLLLLEDRL